MHIALCYDSHAGEETTEQWREGALEGGKKRVSFQLRYLPEAWTSTHFSNHLHHLSLTSK